MVTSSGFYLLASVISTTMAVQVQPVSRLVSSPATCNDGYSWMDNSQGNSPCLTVAYVEGACTGNNYVQPILINGYSYSLPNSSTANECYCSWASYNLMMACALCQETTNVSVWEWPQWASGCATNPSWTQEYFPSGYTLAGDASIPYWAITNPTTWTYETFNIQDANATYQNNPFDTTPSASSSSISSSSSHSTTSSKSTDVDAIIGGTLGALASLSLFAVGAYLVYRRHMYKKGQYASVMHRQPFVSSGDGAAAHMTHNRFPPDSSNFPGSFGSFVLYGQSLSTGPSQYGTIYSSPPQTTYPSMQGSFTPPPRTDTSLYTTHSRHHSNAMPMV
ncbi:uncharacterized protein EDB93DRAFT_842592 [Suillus bovinus]|uniref:uncharacterized protein n=1 Tax=Suillus bovinus TaxID=48563 RepID=UPI001B86481D|nr:uncharacterized protein EDB93DRAFT_842592 [Suillus bovinus]KAG2134593.1 hypothetical protein EDB93DRAFT_842592 [Suillus bovinus]